MSKTQSTLRIREEANLDREIDAFLIDRRARALSSRTIDYYNEKLTLFRAYLQAQGIRAVESITAPIVRRFMLELSKMHNPGGVHAAYRAVRAFLRWYDAEASRSAKGMTHGRPEQSFLASFPLVFFLSAESVLGFPTHFLGAYTVCGVSL